MWEMGIVAALGAALAFIAGFLVGHVVANRNVEKALEAIGKDAEESKKIAAQLRSLELSQLLPAIGGKDGHRKKNKFTKEEPEIIRDANGNVYGPLIIDAPIYHGYTKIVFNGQIVTTVSAEAPGILEIHPGKVILKMNYYQ